MKRNKDFTIGNYVWPFIVFAILIVGAVWTNAGFFDGGLAPIDPQAGGLVPQSRAIIPQMIRGQQAPVPPSNDVHSPIVALDVQEGISRVISLVKPAVVGISRLAERQASITSNTGLSYLDPYSDGDSTMGSGIIIDQRGYILTSFQTVGKQDRVNVVLFSSGKRIFPADVIAIDPNTDLAILKIRDHGVFPTAIIGNSDLLEVGDFVLAIGSPFGFSRTATMGIVSSNNRDVDINGIRYPDLIQTDAAINEGNDGGPLVNIRGEVVGINMASYMPDSQYAGIGFAIPINDIMRFINAGL